MGVRSEALQGPSAPIRSAAFGPQHYSTRRNEPLYSFGSCSLEARANVHLGKEFGRHEQHLVDSPGPAAYHVSQTARLPAGSNVNCKWGADTTGRAYPDLPSPKFRGTPGPGTYRSSSSLGQAQASASLPSTPRYSWGRSASWDTHRSTYVSPAHERERLCTFSPGPHTVGRDAFDSMGRQASSLRRSESRLAPAKADRFTRLCQLSGGREFVKTKGADTTHWPGPGQYNH